MDELFKSLARTSFVEWFAVVTGIIYIVLIMRRHRWGWIAGGISSLALTVVAARARLPMQAALQLSYVLASVYGWWKWSPQALPQKIGIWTWRGHVVVLAVCSALSLLLSALLVREGYSAWPLLDSLVATTGLFATWLVARVFLENWIYWIAIDAISIWLFATQGLVVTALLFVMYLVIACFGLFSWWRLWKQQIPAQS
jgi:nicotinamide mononucleotide transporter